MHATIYHGVYLIGGKGFTDDYDCSILAICDKECLIVGSGGGRSINAILRNYLELGYSISKLRYLLLPIPLNCIAGGCRALKSLLPWIHIVAPKSVATKLRNGVDIHGVEGRYEPCPITIESDTIVLGDRTVKVYIDLTEISFLIEIADLDHRYRILMIFSSKLRYKASHLATYDKVCLVDEPLCIQTH